MTQPLTPIEQAKKALERIKAVSAKEGRTIAWAKAVASEALQSLSLLPTDRAPAQDAVTTRGHDKVSFRNGIRAAITWLHERAKTMNDPKAKTILNTAAFHLGTEKEALSRASLLRQPEAATGWPTAITSAMIEAGFEAHEKQYAGDPMEDVLQKVQAIFKAMLSAAPSAPSVERDTNEIKSCWTRLEEFGFPPEAMGWPENPSPSLADAIEAALDAVIGQREDLFKEVLELRSRVAPSVDSGVSEIDRAIAEQDAFERDAETISAEVNHLPEVSSLPDRCGEDVWPLVERALVAVGRHYRALPVADARNGGLEEALKFARDFSITNSKGEDVPEDSLHEIRKVARAALKSQAEGVALRPAPVQTEEGRTDRASLLQSDGWLRYEDVLEAVKEAHKNWPDDARDESGQPTRSVTSALVMNLERRLAALRYQDAFAAPTPPQAGSEGEKE